MSVEQDDAPPVSEVVAQIHTLSPIALGRLHLYVVVTAEHLCWLPQGGIEPGASVRLTGRSPLQDPAAERRAVVLRQLAGTAGKGARIYRISVASTVAKGCWAILLIGNDSGGHSPFHQFYVPAMGTAEASFIEMDGYFVDEDLWFKSTITENNK